MATLNSYLKQNIKPNQHPLKMQAITPELASVLSVLAERDMMFDNFRHTTLVSGWEWKVVILDRRVFHLYIPSNWVIKYNEGSSVAEILDDTATVVQVVFAAGRGDWEKDWNEFCDTYEILGFYIQTIYSPDFQQWLFVVREQGSGNCRIWSFFPTGDGIVTIICNAWTPQILEYQIISLVNANPWREQLNLTLAIHRTRQLENNRLEQLKKLTDKTIIQKAMLALSKQQTYDFSFPVQGVTQRLAELLDIDYLDLDFRAYIQPFSEAALISPLKLGWHCTSFEFELRGNRTINKSLRCYAPTAWPGLRADKEGVAFCNPEGETRLKLWAESYDFWIAMLQKYLNEKADSIVGFCITSIPNTRFSRVVFVADAAEAESISVYSGCISFDGKSVAVMLGGAINKTELEMLLISAMTIQPWLETQ